MCTEPLYIQGGSGNESSQILPFDSVLLSAGMSGRAIGKRANMKTGFPSDQSDAPGDETPAKKETNKQKASQPPCSLANK